MSRAWLRSSLHEQRCRDLRQLPHTSKEEKSVSKNNQKNNQPSPNDQRSNVKNPNNPAYQQDQANRVAQQEAPPPKPVPGSNPKGRE